MSLQLNDHAYMAQALRLAEQGLYTTRPNPRVGCVIVKDGAVIGQGFHHVAGQPHAEIEALRNAAAPVKDATMYVSLEPCAHQGRTPPCVTSVIESKVKKVVMAMQDPNPKVNGLGKKLLEQNGIVSVVGVLESEAKALNRGYIKRMQTGYPWVTVKSAMSLDGKIALNNGVSKWISSEISRHDVHRLRARSCAILTGIGTILKDDPLLNVRLATTELPLSNLFQQPLRVVVDTNLKVTPHARIFSAPGPIQIYTSTTNQDHISKLKSNHVHVTYIEKDGHGLNIKHVLSDLARQEINEVLVEAGSNLIGTFITQDLVDELVFYVCPHLLGGDAKSLVDFPALEDMNRRINLEIKDVRCFGPDMRVTARLKH